MLGRQKQMTTEEDCKLVRLLMPQWYAYRRWAEEMLCRCLELQSAEEVLRARPRQRRRIPGTNWFYRPHGVGVDVGRGLVCDGIDFDFDEPHPDPWRLRNFAEKQLNAGNLPTEDYRDLVVDDERFITAANIVISQRGPVAT